MRRFIKRAYVRLIRAQQKRALWHVAKQLKDSEYSNESVEYIYSQLLRGNTRV